MPADVDLAAEVERLRALLERQPVCLMRVAADGTLLAVNETALSLLGARGLGDVLDTSFLARVHAEDPHALWDDFITRVSRGGSASVECEMGDLAGARRAVVLQAVTLADHPDGVDSVLMTARDVSTARRLQASLVEQEELRRSAQHTLRDTTVTLEELRAHLQELTAERDRLRAVDEAARAERQQLASALAQLKTALSTAIDATLLAQQIAGKDGTK